MLSTSNEVKLYLTESQPNSRPPPRASPSNSGGGLTQEMFTQAMNQALMMSSMRGNSAPTPATATPSSSSSSGNRDRRNAEEMQLREQFGRHLLQMRELGITDDGLSLRALQATNGDVQAAVNLVFAGLVDD